MPRGTFRTDPRCLNGQEARLLRREIEKTGGFDVELLHVAQGMTVLYVTSRQTREKTTVRCRSDWDRLKNGQAAS